MGQQTSQPTITPSQPQKPLPPRISSVLIPTFYTTSPLESNFRQFDIQRVFTNSQTSQHLMTYAIAPWEQQLCHNMSNNDAIESFQPYIHHDRDAIFDALSRSNWNEPVFLLNRPIFTKYTTNFNHEFIHNTTSNNNNNNDTKQDDDITTTNNFITMIVTSPPQVFIDNDTNHYRDGYTKRRAADNFPRSLNCELSPGIIENFIVPIQTLYNADQFSTNDSINTNAEIQMNHNIITQTSPPTTSSSTTSSSTTTTTTTTSNNKHIFEISTVSQDRFFSAFTNHYEHGKQYHNQLYQHIPFNFLILDLTNGLTIDDLSTIPHQYRKKTLNELITIVKQPKSVYGDLRPILTFCENVTQLINLGCIYPIHLRPIHIVKIGTENLDRHQYRDEIIYQIFESFNLDIHLIQFHDLPQTTTYIELSQLFHTILNEEFAKMIHTHSLSSLLPINNNGIDNVHINNDLTIATQQQQSSQEHQPPNDQQLQSLQQQQQQEQHDIIPPLPTFITLNDFIINSPTLFQQQLSTLTIERHQTYGALIDNQQSLEYLNQLIQSRRNIHLYKMKLNNNDNNNQYIQYNNPQVIVQPSYRPKLYAPYQFKQRIIYPCTISRLCHPSSLLFQSDRCTISTVIQNQPSQQINERMIGGQSFQFPIQSNINLPDLLHFSALFSELLAQVDSAMRMTASAGKFMDSLCSKTYTTFQCRAVHEHYYSRKDDFDIFFVEPFQLSLTQLFSKKCLQTYVYPQYYQNQKNNNYNNNDGINNNHNNINNEQINIQINNYNDVDDHDDNTTTINNSSSIHLNNKLQFPNPNDLSITISIDALTTLHQSTSKPHILMGQLLSLPFQHLFIGFILQINSKQLERTYDTWYSTLLKWEQLESLHGQCIFHPQYLSSTIPPHSSHIPIINDISPQDSLYNINYELIQQFWKLAPIAQKLASYTSWTSIPIHLFVIVPNEWEFNCNKLNINNYTDEIIRDIITTKYEAQTDNGTINNQINICYRFRSMILKQLLLIHTIAFGPYQNQYCNGIIQGGAMGLCNVITHPHLYYRIHFINLKKLDVIKELMVQIQTDALMQRMKIIEESWGI